MDLDPQAHLTAVCGAVVTASERSLYGFYCNGASLSGLIKFVSTGWKVKDFIQHRRPAAVV